MANKLSIVILCLALVVVHTTAAREMPSDNGLSDQKNVFGGAGGIAGIGNNGLPFGGVVSGVGGNVGGFGAGIGGGIGGGGLGGTGGVGGLGGLGGTGGVGGLGGLGGIGGGAGASGGGGAGSLPLP